MLCTSVALLCCAEWTLRWRGNAGRGSVEKRLRAAPRRRTRAWEGTGASKGKGRTGEVGAREEASLLDAMWVR
eukprot:3833596-Rhodomonas_salina.2